MSKGKLIYVVEDESTIRESLRDILESEGYRVVTAQNGKDALEKLATQSAPDLILLDMLMPIMGGDEFLRIIGASIEFAPIPVLVVSATANAGTTVGARAFIKKPPDLDLLLRMVEKYLAA